LACPTGLDGASLHVFRPAKYRNAKRSPLPSDILKYRIQTGRAPIAVDGVERGSNAYHAACGMQHGSS
jgi:hypothetical protein